MFEWDPIVVDVSGDLGEELGGESKIGSFSYTDPKEGSKAKRKGVGFICLAEDGCSDELLPAALYLWFYSYHCHLKTLHAQHFP